MRRVLEAAIRERRKAERRGASYNPFIRPGVNGAAPPAPAHNHSRGFELGQFIHRVEDEDYNG